MPRSHLVASFLVVIAFAFAGCVTAPPPARKPAVATTPVIRPAPVAEPVKNDLPPLPAGTFELTDADVAPQAIVHPLPNYPAAWCEQGMEGFARASIRIDESGNVTDIVILEATDIRFAREAESALRRWRFKPAERAGQPVATRAIMPVKFIMAD